MPATLLVNGRPAITTLTAEASTARDIGGWDYGPPLAASLLAGVAFATPQGSGIFASGWGANRAAVYGVEEQDLGKFYAQRTILKREVLPDNIANAVFVLCTDQLSHTTVLHIPVDAGVAAAFLR